MISFSRVANNAIVLMILAGFFYLIYMKMKGKGVTLDKFKGLFSKGKV